MTVATHPPPFAGVVLTGGASRRFGRDKALVPVGGVPMAVRVRDALVRAGAVEVVAVGGDLDGLHAAGLRAVDDLEAGAGPLGGVLGGLASVGATLVVVAACDLPFLTADAVGSVVAGLVADPSALAAVADVDGVAQWHLLALWSSAAPVLEEAFVAGERSLRRALADVPVGRIASSRAALADVDDPADLDRYAAADGAGVPAGGITGATSQ